MSVSAKWPEVRRNRPVSGARIGAPARPRFLIQILPPELMLSACWLGISDLKSAKNK
jgi:hypothetical protein